MKLFKTKKGISAVIAISFLFLFTGCRNGAETTERNGANPSLYNVVWDSPSANAFGSMPVGNGDIGLNVWVENNGDICFYIGKTDSWGDNGRLLKVGKVRVKCEPAIIFPGAAFTQELDLATGTIKIRSKGKYDGEPVDFSLQILVDANHPVIYVINKSSVPVKMSASIELWRTRPDSLPELNVSDLLEDRSKPGNMHEPVIVEPDIILKGTDDYVGWYHFNKKSAGFDLTNKIQGLTEYFKQDPILHRTFGAVITGTGATKIDDLTIETGSSGNGRLSIFVLTRQPSLPDEWQKAIEEVVAETDEISFDKRLREHRHWWEAFWNNSWIHARSDTDSGAFTVAKAYALQRFIDASAGRGRYPIKFNGSLFTVPHPDKPGGPDYRRWGPGYWWQNTRLPYLSMCAAGDYEFMKPFFNMYAGDIFELNKFRTKKYFNFDGAYFPECLYFWGSVFTETYGWTPFEKRQDPLQVSGYHKWEWVAGPELVFMMLDYYDYTGDTSFLLGKTLPVANEVIRFFDNYYKTDASGKLVMHPSQSAETWWDCTDPMPEIAGLQGITKRLLNLPASVVTESDRHYWEIFRKKIPDLPLRDTPDGKALAPAASFAEKHNVENPELYAVFPFRLIALGNPHLEWGINALKHRWDKGDFGWRQDDIFMAYLGLTEQARKYIVSRARQHDKKMRFPAFWGPNYDWTPDQDHGGILMKAFQSMILQPDPYSSKMYLLPAWPTNWEGEFKLHAPYNTVIEAKIRNGEIRDLKVTPKVREKDIIIHPGKK